MLLNRLTVFSAALSASVGLAAAIPSSYAAEPAPVLFSNPLVRESAAAPKLQSLRFITVDGFAPFSAFDSRGTMRGVHVDLARAICAELNLTADCTLQAVAFEDVENLLVSGQADIALAGLVPSAQNRKDLSFSIPYFRYASKFLVQKGPPLKIGASVGVIKDSAHQQMMETLFPEFKPAPFATEAEAFTALKAGTVSALFGDGLRMALALSEDTALSCCVLQRDNYFLPRLRPDTLVAAVAKSRSDILTGVNNALRQLAADGRLDEVYLRHVPVNPLK
jgi:polar amino acid transport system substrate-binding protein